MRACKNGEVRGLADCCWRRRAVELKGGQVGKAQKVCVQQRYEQVW